MTSNPGKQDNIYLLSNIHTDFMMNVIIVFIYTIC